MYFLGLTLSVVLWIAGAILMFKGEYIIGGGVIVVGTLLFTYMAFYYKKNKKPYNADCSPQTIDSHPLVPDCDCV